MIAVFVAFLTFFSTLFGGFVALRFKDRLHLILGFASGAVVGTALFEILPEVIAQAKNTGTPTTSLFLFSALGFLLFHTLEKIFSFQKIAGQGHLAASGFSIHSFFDGLGIGIGFLTNFQLGLIVYLSVLAHDFSDGLNTATVVLKNRGKKFQAIKWLVVVASTPILGVLASFLIPNAGIFMPYILAFYFGFFLYLGASDLLPEAHHRHSSYPTLIATFLGFALIYLISFLSGVSR